MRWETHGIKRLMRVMKLSVLLLLIGFLQLSANTYGQKEKLTLKMQDVTAQEVFKQLEKQAGLKFFYQDEQLNKIGHVSVNASNQSLNDVLSEMLDHTGLTYKLIDNHVIILAAESVGNKGSIQSQLTIKGSVTDKNGDPIPGVNVFEKSNPQNGVITGIDGMYTIKVDSPEDILVFSFIGFDNQEITVGGTREINVTLMEQSTGLDEVVVTAFGVRRDRKSLGYAISKIEGKQLVDAGTPVNPLQSLYGKAAGVVIRQSATGPTGGININIRGAAGLQADANTRPLFVIDGVPIFDENTGLSDPNNPWANPTDYGSGINDINSDDIESIEILKGAKASVLYGSEGANGVVLITTKSGRGAKKAFQADVSYQTTIEQPLTYIEFQNIYGSGNSIYDVKDIEDGEQYPRANFNSRNYGPAFDATQKRIWWDNVARPYVARPDNYDFLFSDGSSQQINAAVSGSGDYGNVRFSFTNSDYNGIMEGNTMKKNIISFSGRFNFTDKLSIETTTNIYKVKGHNRPQKTLGFFTDGVSRGAPFQEFIESGDYLYTDPTDPNFGYKKDFDEVGYPTGYYSLKDYQNYVWDRRNNSATDDKLHLITTIRPTYRFNDWLNVVGQASLDYTDTDFTTKNAVTKVYPEMVGGYYGFRRRNTQVEEYKGFINFTKPMINNRLNIFSMLGTSYKKVSENSVNVSTANVGSSTGFNYPNWYHLNNQNPAGWPGSNNMGKVRGNSFGENSLYSVFGVVALTWDDVYTIELNARNDWSSTLPPDNNSYFYPGIAFTYEATKLLKPILPSLQFGKFRASWADVGRDAPSRYYAYNSLSSGVIEGTDAQSVAVPSSLFAGDLKPERKREFEIGTELNFFKGNRLGVDFSYYTNNVYDQIMSVPLTPSSGANEIKINAGNVKNWGYELQLTGTPLLTRNFRWDVMLTTANQYSEVKKLYDGITEKNVNSMRGKVFVKAIEGERIGNIYGTGIKMDPDGNRIVGADGSSYALDEKEHKLIGNVNPNFIGGFNTNFAYKGLRLNMHFDYSFGASMYSETNQWLYYNGTSVQSLENRDEAHGGLAYYVDADGNNVAWEHSKPEGPNGERVYHDGIILPGVVDNGDGTYSENTKIASVASYYGGFVSWAGEAINAVDLKYKNDYIKIREISLSYTLPNSLTQKAKLSNVTLNFFARNIGYVYKTVPNLDAEAYMGTNSYFEASAIPSARTLGMRVSVGF